MIKPIAEMEQLGTQFPTPVHGDTPTQREVAQALTNLRHVLQQDRDNIAPNMYAFLSGVISDLTVSFNAEPDQTHNNLRTSILGVQGVLQDLLNPFCSQYQVFLSLQRLLKVPFVRVEPIKEHIGRIQFAMSSHVNSVEDQPAAGDNVKSIMA